MNTIKKLHCQLFGLVETFNGNIDIDRSKAFIFSNYDELRCDGDIFFTQSVTPFPETKKYFFKKNAAKKKTINRLTFAKSKRIFGVFYIFTLTNIKRAFFSLNRVPKSRAKGTKIQGIEANSLSNPLKDINFIKMIRVCVEARMMKSSQMSRFNIRQKGTKIQGMSVNEAKKREKGTTFQGIGTTFRGGICHG